MNLVVRFREGLNPVRAVNVSARGLRSLGVFLACLTLAACESGPTLAEFGGNTMGTTYSVQVVDQPRDIDMDRLQRQVAAVLGAVNSRMSTYLENSELSRFNASRETKWLDASSELVSVVQHAQSVSELTGGAFDITVGPLVNLWGFGPEVSRDQTPSDEAVERAKQRIGYRRLHVKNAPAGLKKDVPDLYVDLSAIAKGYAVDQAAELLESQGILNYLVEVGGEVRGRGHNKRGIPWQIAIEKPHPGIRAVQQVIAVHEVSVATSGDYRNYFEQDGRRYSHTIDPRTGRPVNHTLASVTVLSPSAMHADAMATGLMVMGPDAGYALAEREALAVVFIVRTEDGFVSRASPAFARYGDGDSS